MNVHEFYPDRFLKPGHLGGHTVTAIVENVETEELGFPKRRCLVMGFKGKSRRMVLTRKKALTVSQVFGPETTLWIGRRVELAAVQVKVGDRLVDTIQVTPIAAAADTNAPATPAAEHQTSDRPGHSEKAPAPATGPERPEGFVRPDGTPDRERERPDDGSHRPRPGVVFNGKR
jgi:hypothetical protein